MRAVSCFRSVAALCAHLSRGRSGPRFGLPPSPTASTASRTRCSGKLSSETPLQSLWLSLSGNGAGPLRFGLKIPMVPLCGCYRNGRKYSPRVCYTPPNSIIAASGRLGGSARALQITLNHYTMPLCYVPVTMLIRCSRALPHAAKVGHLLPNLIPIVWRMC